MRGQRSLPRIARVLRVMRSDRTRVRLLWALRDVELDVATLAEVAGCWPTVASQHLSKLRFAGLVEGGQCGQRVAVPLNYFG